MDHFSAPSDNPNDQMESTSERIPRHGKELWHLPQAPYKQKSPRKLSEIACACLLSGSLLAGPAHAVTPD
ncbi:hypothetical protein CN221_38350, partial [Sinorhizobium meliloti]